MRREKKSMRAEGEREEEVLTCGQLNSFSPMDHGQTKASCVLPIHN